MKTIKKYYFLMLLVLLISCNDNNEDDSLSKNIIPLEVGYKWTYVDSFFSSNGDVRLDTSILGITNKKEFILYEDKSVELYYWNWFDFENNEFANHSWLCKNDIDGIYFYGGVDQEDIYLFEKSLSVKYPVEVGESWFSLSYVYHSLSDTSFFEVGDTLQVSCVSTNEIFHALNKNFSCYKYYTKYYVTMDRLNHIYKYYRPGIGLIGYIIERDGEKVFTRTLISYTL